MSESKFPSLASYGLTPDEKIPIHLALIHKYPDLPLHKLIEVIHGQAKSNRLKIRVRKRHSRTDTAKRVIIYYDPKKGEWMSECTTIDGRPIKKMSREEIHRIPELYSDDEIKYDGKTHPHAQRLIEEYFQEVKETMCKKISGHIMSIKSQSEMETFINKNLPRVIDEIVNEALMNSDIVKKFGMQTTDMFYEQYIGAWYENIFNYINDFGNRVCRKANLIIADLTQKFNSILVKITPKVIKEHQKYIITKTKELVEKKVEKKKISERVHQFWYDNLMYHFEHLLGMQSKNVYALVAEPIPDTNLPDIKYDKTVQPVSDLVGAFIGEEMWGDDNPTEPPVPIKEPREEPTQFPEPPPDISIYPELVEYEKDQFGNIDLSKPKKASKIETFPQDEINLYDMMMKLKGYKMRSFGEKTNIPSQYSQMVIKHHQLIGEPHWIRPVTKLFAHPIPIPSETKPTSSKIPQYMMDSIYKQNELIEYLLEHPTDSAMIVIVDPKTSTMKRYIIQPQDVKCTKEGENIKLVFPESVNVEAKKSGNLKNVVELKESGEITHTTFDDKKKISERQLMKELTGLYNMLFLTEK